MRWADLDRRDGWWTIPVELTKTKRHPTVSERPDQPLPAFKPTLVAVTKPANPGEQEGHQEAGLSL
jgi:hypothetical protein